MAEPNAYYAVARNPPNFNTLPPELRVKIIQEMFFPRTITLTYDIMVLGPFLGSCLTPNPTVLHISREIRAEALRYYHPVQPWDEHSVVYLNPLVDSLSVCWKTAEFALRLLLNLPIANLATDNC